MKAHQRCDLHILEIGGGGARAGLGKQDCARCCIAVIVCASRASRVEARFRWCRAPTPRGDPT